MGALMNVLLDIEIDLLGFACIIILCLQGPTSQKVYEITNESLKYFMKILFFLFLWSNQVIIIDWTQLTHWPLGDLNKKLDK